MIDKFLAYLQFWKKQDNTSSFNLKMMHRVNRISLLIFLFALIYMAFKYLIL